MHYGVMSNMENPIKPVEVIALDVEGTLISNAMSQFARPRLYEFLEGCKSITERIVIYTTVKEDLFRRIASLLLSESCAPEWFNEVEYIHWEGSVKDLNFIPDSSVETSVIVDDYSDYIASGQEERWIEIPQFAHPYPDSDIELDVVLERLKSF